MDTTIAVIIDRIVGSVLVLRDSILEIGMRAHHVAGGSARA